ncbi:MAG: hypothetical protein JWL80_238 [Parcubacteria group bacterium]|nr:hypothetical protein [Parcubacteria group bacterium]
MRSLQVFLLGLIIAGVGMLIARDMWVPKLVDRILADESSEWVPIVATTSASVKSSPPPREGKLVTGVEGIVTIGPTCPVVKIPDDGTCADKPYQTTLVLITNIVGRNGGILIKTDKNGYFSRTLSPGNYTIRAQENGMLPRLEPVTFDVKENQRVSLNLTFDSGIR